MKKNRFDSRIKLQNRVLIAYERDKDPLEISGFSYIQEEGLFRMKNKPQYIVIIEVIRDKVSKSFKSSVLNGCFLKFIIKNRISMRKTIKAQAAIPKLLMKIAAKIIVIFLYIMIISQ